MVLAKKRVHSFMCTEPERDKEGVHAPLFLKVILKKMFKKRVKIVFSCDGGAKK